MSKSLYVVGGIGLFGCIALSLMMQHLLKVQNDNSQSPVAAELEEAFQQQIDGDVTAESIKVSGELTLVLRFRTRGGVDRERFARGASKLVWRRSHRFPDLPDRMRFEISDSAGGEPVVVTTTRPRIGRMRRQLTPPVQQPTPPKPNEATPAKPGGR